MARDRSLTFRNRSALASVRDGGSLANDGSTESHPSRVARSRRRCSGCRSVRPRACARCMPTPPRVGRHRKSNRPAPCRHRASASWRILAAWARASATHGWRAARARTKEERGGRSRHSHPALAVGAVRLEHAPGYPSLAIVRYWTFGQTCVSVHVRRRTLTIRLQMRALSHPPQDN